jgi:hypothetical protein
LKRRTFLTALSMTAALGAGVACAAAAAPTPPLAAPPDDTYGFSSTLRAEGIGGPVARDLSSWVRALKVLGEAPLLTADAPASGPAFRLTVLSAQRPAVTIRVTWSDDHRSATALISTGDGLGVPGARLKTVRRDFTGPAAASLLALADARESFWDAAPVPPAWDAIQKLADCPACPVVAPVGDEVLLEGRIGARRHLIVRLNPQPGTGPAAFQALVLAPEKLPPPKPGWMRHGTKKPRQG